MRTTVSQCDVVIIGAGPAGCMAAAHLARAGFSVHVFERRSFPRNKVCGGCLSSLALAVLDRSFSRRPEMQSVTSITFVLATGHEKRVSIADDAAIILRSTFDEWLAQQARQAGAEIHFNTPALLFGSGGEQWSVRHMPPGSDAQELVQPRVVLVGTGLSQVPLIFTDIAGRGRTMVGLQWTCPPNGRPGAPEPGEIDMHWLRGGYVGIAALSSQLLNVAVAVDTDSAPGPRIIQRLRDANPRSRVWELIDAGDDGAEATAGFPFQPARLRAGNAWLIGDAAGYAEPFTGEGIGLAMLSSLFAAQALTLSRDVHDAGRLYDSLMRRYHRPALSRCRRWAAVLRSRRVNRLMQWIPFVSDAVLPHMIRRIHLGMPSVCVPGLELAANAGRAG